MLSDSDDVLWLLLFMAFSAIFAAGVSFSTTSESWEKHYKALQVEAVQTGHAEWSTDDEGNVEFKWLPTQEEE